MHNDITDTTRQHNANDMSQQRQDPHTIIAAHLDYLTIFCPELSTSEKRDTDQLLFHYAHASEPGRPRNKPASDDGKQGTEAAHKRMRQIGLAQGMVNFARTFGGGRDVDAIETETHRTVLKELEKGWWVLASIRLTRLPSTRQAQGYEHSSREISPPILLIAQLLRAHRIFLLHHGRNLQELYLRFSRNKFCNLLEKYWANFAKDWNIFLHGNPVADVYNGMRLVDGGELATDEEGEAPGSKERTALQGLMRNNNGLIDLIVSSVHNSLEENDEQRPDKTKTVKSQQSIPRASLVRHSAEGVIFTGSGTLSRRSIRTLDEWIRIIHREGANAYGVGDNPLSERSNRLRQRRTAKPDNHSPKRNVADSESMTALDPMPYDAGDVGERPSYGRRPTIRPPLIDPLEKSSKAATASAASRDVNASGASERAKSTTAASTNNDAYTWTDVFTLGYGKWNRDNPGSRTSSRSREQIGKDMKGSQYNRSSSLATTRSRLSSRASRGSEKTQSELKAQPDRGYFLIGLLGDLDQEHENSPGDAEDCEGSASSDTRLLVRTVHVEVNSYMGPKSPASELRTYLGEGARPDRYELKRVRVVVFQHRAFFFTLLFEHMTPSLAIPSFYMTLRKQLEALHKPLLDIVSLRLVSKRLNSLHSQPDSSDKSSSRSIESNHSSRTLYHVCHNPHTLVTLSTFPSIPAPGLDSIKPHLIPRSVSRLEAVHLHTVALSQISDTRYPSTARSQTARTARGWWLAWVRVPSEQISTSFSPSSPHASRDIHHDVGRDSAADAPPQTPPTLGSSEVEATPKHCEAVVMWRATEGDLENGTNIKESDGGDAFAGAFGMMGLGSVHMPSMFGSGTGNPNDDSGKRMPDDSTSGQEEVVDVRQYVEEMLSLS